MQIVLEMPCPRCGSPAQTPMNLNRLTPNGRPVLDLGDLSGLRPWCRQCDACSVIEGVEVTLGHEEEVVTYVVD